MAGRRKEIQNVKTKRRQINNLSKFLKRNQMNCHKTLKNPTQSWGISRLTQLARNSILSESQGKPTANSDQTRHKSNKLKVLSMKGRCINER
jgi:hypothetical protein